MATNGVSDAALAAVLEQATRVLAENPGALKEVAARLRTRGPIDGHEVERSSRHQRRSHPPNRMADVVLRRPAAASASEEGTPRRAGVIRTSGKGPSTRCRDFIPPTPTQQRHRLFRRTD